MEWHMEAVGHWRDKFQVSEVQAAAKVTGKSCEWTGYKAERHLEQKQRVKTHSVG